MTDVPTDWVALCTLVFLLGLRHGVDADHLAAIDGMTRLSSRRGAGFSRWCGALFSLGHGAVVMLIAFSAGLASTRWQAPAWLDWVGAWVSIGFLLLLGSLNLRAVLTTDRGAPVVPVGLRARCMAGLFVRVRSPWAVAAVGALFAISFDTLSQSLLFAVLGTRFGGVDHAVILGALFIAGMLAADGLNGWWIARLIARTDSRAVRASRVMSWTVSLVSFSVAGFSIARMALPDVAQWWEGKELWLGAGVVAVVACGYAAAWAAGRDASKAASLA